MVLPMQYNASTVKIGDLTLASGQLLRNVEIAYERVGPRDAPTILVCHALTGNQYAVGEPEQPGWWAGLIGEHKYVDTTRYQVITTNVLGGCNGSTGPLSMNPEMDQPYRSHFPFITVRDMVHAQYEALRSLGITHLHAIIGGSLGGMQVLEWGIMYPDYMDILIPLAVTPYLSDYGIAYNTLGRLAITQDPAWQDGLYALDSPPATGLSLARIAGMLTYRSAELFSARFDRSEKEGWGISHEEVAYQVESYLIHQGQKLVQRFDANSYLYLLKAMDQHDIGYLRGEWRDAIKAIQAKVIALGYRNDLLYPPDQIQAFVDVCRDDHKQAIFVEIDTPFAHDGFLADYPKWGHIIQEGLNETY